MVTYTITNGTTPHNIIEMGGVKDGENLDIYTVIADGTYANNTDIIIYYDSTPIFYGVIKRVEEQSEGGTYKLTCYERSYELKGMQYLSGSAAVFSKTSISVTNLVDDILTGSGWTRPTSTDATVITTFSCYYVNKMQALQKVLREMRGHWIWFDSNNKYVYFGSLNTDHTGSGNISYIEKKLKSSTEARNITKVIVLGKEPTISGTDGTGTNVATFQASDIITSTEAASLAAIIRSDIGNEYNTYVVTVDPSQYSYNARDKIKVDLVDYYIKEIDHTLNEIKLTIDTGAVSVVDSMGSRIKEVTGEFPTGSDAQWSGGNTNVAANAAESTTYIFDIKDATMISNPYIDATIGDYIKTTAVAAETEFLSAVDAVLSTSAGTDEASFVSSFYVPNSSGTSITYIADGFQHALFTLNCQMAAYASAIVSVELQLSYNNGSSWSSTIGTAYSALTTSIRDYNITGMASGSATSETSGQMKFRLYVSATQQLKAWNLYGTLYRIPRHKHSVTTTYDKTTISGSKPSTIQVSINGESFYTTLTPGTPLRINTYWTLITGKNTISIKTPSGAGNQCSVNPTITYQTLGKS
jgi:hypothetical protein